MFTAPTGALGAGAIKARRLGSFDLCYELGRGGMASVYMARERAGGRLVALKVMHPHLATDPSYIEMFADEARLAAHIRHPNVCGVESHGADDDRHYMVQELLSGESFWALVRRQSSAKEIHTTGWIALATSIVADALDGLEAVHEAVDADGRRLDAVHRDVSPHNIVVEYDGRVRVVDLGIAHAAERRQKTQTGVLKGKMGYVAPEQLVGGDVDRRVDVWAAGVTLWEALTGRFLFREKGTLPTLRAVQGREVPAPSSINSLVPAALDEIVLEALRRDRDQRPATAGAMALALREAVAPLAEPFSAEARAEWMASVFGPELLHHQQLQEMARFRDALDDDDPEALEAAPTRLTTMAEILPFEEITDLDLLAEVDDSEVDEAEAFEEPTRILDVDEGDDKRKAKAVVALLSVAALLAAIVTGVLLLDSVDASAIEKDAARTALSKPADP